MKQCRDCLQSKDAREFNRQASEPDGLDARCRQCKKARARAYYLKTRQLKGRHKPPQTAKTCAACKQELPPSSFIRKKSGRLHSYCRDCHVSRAKQWEHDNKERARATARRYYAENRDMLREKAKAWAAANPDKAKQITLKKNYGRKQRLRDRGGHDDAERRELIESYLGRCVYCNNGHETLDHVVPLCAGGTNYISNIAPSCLACNSSKGSRSLLQFMMNRSSAQK